MDIGRATHTRIIPSRTGRDRGGRAFNYPYLVPTALILSVLVANLRFGNRRYDLIQLRRSAMFGEQYDKIVSESDCAHSGLCSYCISTMGFAHRLQIVPFQGYLLTRSVLD